MGDRLGVREGVPLREALPVAVTVSVGDWVRVGLPVWVGDGEALGEPLAVADPVDGKSPPLLHTSVLMGTDGVCGKIKVAMFASNPATSRHRYLEPKKTAL